MRSRIAALLAVLMLALTASSAATAAPMTLNFQQQTTTATPADNPVLIASESALNLNNFFNYNSAVLDVRAYSSMGLNLQLTGGTFLFDDLVQMRIDWFADPAAATLIYRDEYYLAKTDQIWTRAVRLTDAMHGAYMRVQLLDANSVGRTVNLTYQLFGSYRAVANTFLRTNADGIIYQEDTNLAAGASSTVRPLALSYGRWQVTLLSGAAGGATLTLRFGSNVAGTASQITLIAPAAATRVTQEIIVPRQQAFVMLTNNAGVLQEVTGYITREIDSF